MVRMSDILKKLQSGPSSQGVKPKDEPSSGKSGLSGKEAHPVDLAVKEGPSREDASAAARPGQEAVSAFARTVGQKEQPAPDVVSGENKPAIQISLAMKEFEPDMQRSKELYLRALKLAQELIRKSRAKQPIAFKDIKTLNDELVNYLLLGDKTLLSLFYDNYDPQEYLPYHMVNVMIMAVSLGLGLRYNRSKVDELSLGAFLNDIGMSEYLDLALQPKRLSEGEYNQVKNHPSASAAILSSIREIPEIVIQAVKDCHERFDGKGYPGGAKDGEISEYARIIAIADVYEALVHSRAYRKKRLAHEVIKEMLSSSSSSFDGRALKAFINLIGIYPAGSYVELNSAEIAKVINSSDNFPLRPVVNVIFDSGKRRLNEPRLINLAKQFNLYIKNQLSDEDVAKLTKEG